MNVSAQNTTQLWKPVFSPKTGLTCWKVNAHCEQYVALSRQFVRCYTQHARLLWVGREEYLTCKLEIRTTANIQLLVVQFCRDGNVFEMQLTTALRWIDLGTVSSLCGFMCMNGSIHSLMRIFIKCNEHTPYKIDCVYLQSAR